MFQRILVALDFTEKNLRALEIAREAAIQSKASVVLLHVIETVEHVPFQELKNFYTKLEGTARELRESTGFPFTRIRCLGHPIDEFRPARLRHRAFLDQSPASSIRMSAMRFPPA